MRRNVIATIAGCAALAVLTPAAIAQNGFPDYRQAAADQYPTQPPPATSGSGSSPAPVTGGSSGSPRPAHRPHKPGGTTTQGSGTQPSGASGTAPVAVPSRPVPAAKGSLPFTGSDLSGLVVLALLLIATGLLLAAATRATRRRRRRAPA